MLELLLDTHFAGQIERNRRRSCTRSRRTADPRRRSSLGPSASSPAACADHFAHDEGVVHLTRWRRLEPTTRAPSFQATRDSPRLPEHGTSRTHFPHPAPLARHERKRAGRPARQDRKTPAVARRLPRHRRGSVRSRPGNRRRACPRALIASRPHGPRASLPQTGD